MNRRFGTLRNPPWTLLACCAVVAALLALEWVHFGNATIATEGNAPRDAAPADAAHPERFVPPPAERFAEIAERPLFVPDRRPQPDQVVPPTSVPPPALALQGVVLAPERHYAVIRHGNPPTLDSITEGTVVDGWTVKLIGTDRIVLDAAGATIEFEVEKAGARTEPERGRVPITDRRPGDASGHY